MSIEPGLFMSKKELIEFEIIEKFRFGKLSRVEAAAKLEVSIRTITRKAKRIREEGIRGLCHRNRGKKPKVTKPEDLKGAYLNLYKEKYFDFNYTHALEMIEQNENLPKVSYTTFRLWCRAKGIGKIRKRRASKARVSRERSANRGLMLQMDGSHHQWVKGKKWCLINLIDDATSEMPFAEFFDSETTFACLKALKAIIEEFGIPEFILTDCAGWSTGSKKRENFSQFIRACEELGIKVIATSSPESKGRVERSYRTIQDRLVPELRINAIKSMKDANRYLKQVFKPQWNERWTVAPSSETSRYQPVPKTLDLNQIFCKKDSRIINKAQGFSYNNNYCRITDKFEHNLYKHSIEICEYEDGSRKYYYNGNEVKVSRERLPRFSPKKLAS